MYATRILVVSSFLLLREGLCALLQANERWQVVGHGANEDQVRQIIRETQPDVVILDVPRADASTEALIRTIRSVSKWTGIIVLSRDLDNDGFMRLMRAGARSCLGARSGVSDLFAAVQAAATGNSYLCPEATRALLREYRRKQTDTARSQA